MLKVPYTERGARKCEVPQTALEHEKLQIPRKECEEGKGGGKRRSVNGPALDNEGKACPLARDVVKEAAENVNRERLDMLDYSSLGQ